jgi:hypothetical protein
MKFKLYKIISLCCLVLILSNCGNKDKYDWSNVDPGKQSITGIDTIRGNDVTTYDYYAIPRGGSTFDWSSSFDSLTITIDTPYMSHVKAKTTKDTSIMLYVKETTWGGKTSMDTLKLFIQGFCPFNINELIGNGKYTCSESGGYVPFDVNFSILGTDTIEVDNFSNNGWPIKYILSGDINEKATITDNHYSYNGEPVIVKGSGTYNTCNGIISINFAVVRPTGDTVLNSDNSVYAGTDKFTR